tara:strand:- start:452 stop:595 length:144 start_codon:yes stop_codon:yes gene_type:complete
MRSLRLAQGTTLVNVLLAQSADRRIYFSHKNDYWTQQEVSLALRPPV